MKADAIASFLAKNEAGPASRCAERAGAARVPGLAMTALCRFTTVALAALTLSASLAAAQVTPTEASRLVGRYPVFTGYGEYSATFTGQGPIAGSGYSAEQLSSVAPDMISFELRTTSVGSNDGSCSTSLVFRFNVGPAGTIVTLTGDVGVSIDPRPEPNTNNWHQFAQVWLTGAPGVAYGGQAFAYGLPGEAETVAQALNVNKYLSAGQWQLAVLVQGGPGADPPVPGFNLAHGAAVGELRCHPRCADDLDDGTGSGTPDGGVDINDLLYFLGGFEAGDLAGDLDDGNGQGVPDGGVDINDLLFFLSHFEVGC